LVEWIHNAGRILECLRDTFDSPCEVVEDVVVIERQNEPSVFEEPVVPDTISGRIVM